MGFWGFVGGAIAGVAAVAAAPVVAAGAVAAAGAAGAVAAAGAAVAAGSAAAGTAAAAAGAALSAAGAVGAAASGAAGTALSAAGTAATAVTGAATSAGTAAVGAVKTAAGVALNAGAAVSEVAGNHMLTVAAQMDKAAIATGEKIAGELGAQTVTTITEYGTKAAQLVGNTVNQTTTNLASNITNLENAKIIGNSAGHLSKGATKLKLSEKTMDGVEAVAEEVSA